MLTPGTHERTYRHLQLFCGIGGLSRGISDGRARAFGLAGRWEPIGAIDVDPVAIAAYKGFTGAKGTVLDLFDRRQYEDFWGTAPPAGWREAGVEDIRRAAGGERPHLVALSPPCKGFSGLLRESMAASRKYQALNALTLRGLWLALEAFADDPPEFILMENVPRIMTRGKRFLDEIEALLVSYGYAVNRDSHCCGEIGGLAQRRRRFLLVARHRAKVSQHLHQPRRHALRSIGEVLGPLGLPGNPALGALHQPRRLAWKTAVRLALIPPGGDWRDLQKLNVKDGHLKDYVLVDANWNGGALGVIPWNSGSGTVTASALATRGRFSLEDPRVGYTSEYGQLGVQRWEEPSGTVTAGTSPGQGRFSIADHRVNWSPSTLTTKYAVREWGQPSGTITTTMDPSSGAPSVADPRIVRLADPRTDRDRSAPATSWANSGQYGVVPWSHASGAVTAVAKHDTGRFSVADPRLPDPGAVDVYVILGVSGFWHRPMTTAELAELQGFDLMGHGAEWAEGLSDTKARELVGMAVPPPAAKVIGEAMLRTLLARDAGDVLLLDSELIWTRQARRAAALCQVDAGVAA